MMTCKHLFTPALLGCLLAWQPVQAQDTDNHWYVGGKLGAASTDERWIDDDDTSYGLYAGYRFHRIFAIEAEYTDFGNLRVDLGDLEIRSSRLEPRTWGLRLVGHVPMTPRFDLLASIGYHSFDLDPRDDQGFRDVVGSRSSTDLFYGLGGQYNFSNRWSLRAQVQRYEFRRAGDSDEVSLGLHARF